MLQRWGMLTDRITNAASIAPAMAARPGSTSCSAVKTPARMISRWTPTIHAFSMPYSGEHDVCHIPCRVAGGGGGVFNLNNCGVTGGGVHGQQENHHREARKKRVV